MGNFTSTFTYESDFDGDHVKVELRRLKRRHVAKLSPFFTGDDGNFNLTISEQIPLLAALEEILPECVVSMDGLKDRANNPLKISDIVEDVYFMPFLIGLLTELLNNSFVKPDDEKKSEPQPPAASSVGIAASNR